MRKIRTRNLLLGLIISLITVLPIQLMTGYVSDDYRYRFFYGGEDFENARLFNNFILEISQSMINHWQMVNGRLFAHSIVQLLMQFDRNVFVFLNVIMFALLWICILKFAKVEYTLKNVVAIIALLLVTLPQMGQTVFWLSGSVNYLWMTVFQLAFMIFAVKYFTQEENCQHRWQFASLLMLALLVGNSNESGGAAVLIALTVWVAFKGKSVSNWIRMALLDVFGVIGFLVSLSSPGSRQRNETGGIFEAVNLRHILTWGNWGVHQFGVLSVLIICLVVFLVVKKKMTTQTLIQVEMMVPLVAFLVSSLMLFVSPEFYARIAFFGCTMLVTILMKLFNQIEWNRNMQSSIVISVLAYAMFSVALGAVNVHRTYVIDKHNTDLLLCASKSKKVTLTKPRVFYDSVDRKFSKYNAFEGTRGMAVGVDDDWFNGWMSKFYNVKSIQGKW